MKRLLFILLMVISAMIGCVQKSQEPELTGVTIAFQEWVGYGLFYLGQEKGFFKQEGIELIIVDEQLDSARRYAFKQGMLDFEAGTADLLISKASQDTPVVGVMEIDQSSGSDAIVAAENIKSLEDLPGKKVALARDDVGEFLLAALFKKKGLPLDSLVIVPSRPEDVARTFIDGKADACVTWEPQVTQARQRPGAHILASTKDYPGIVIDILNARRDLVDNKPELVKKVMRGWFKALDYYQRYPREACEIISKYYRLSPDEYRKQIEGLKWNPYENQRTDEAFNSWIDAFDIIAEVKLAGAGIPVKTDVRKFINHKLVETLYENSK